jgi:hypothetical protein
VPVEGRPQRRRMIGPGRLKPCKLASASGGISSVGNQLAKVLTLLPEPLPLRLTG